MQFLENHPIRLSLTWSGFGSSCRVFYSQKGRVMQPDRVVRKVEGQTVVSLYTWGRVCATRYVGFLWMLVLLVVVSLLIQWTAHMQRSIRRDGGLQEFL